MEATPKNEHMNVHFIKYFRYFMFTIVHDLCKDGHWLDLIEVFLYCDIARSYNNPGPLSLYLLFGDAHLIPHVRENCGLNEEPFQAQSFASTLQLGSFTDATLDKLQHTILLLPTDL